MPNYKVRLEICGSTYTISTDEPAEYMEALAEKLDEDMKLVMQSSANSSVVSAAVLTALSYLDSEQKNRQATDNMRSQIQDYLEDAAKAKLAAEEARREADRLRRELNYYEKKAGKPEKEEKDTAPSGSLLDLPRKPAAPETSYVPSQRATPAAAKLEEADEEIEGQLGLADYDE